MGQSTDAILAFGMDVGDEWSLPGVDSEDEDSDSTDLGEFLARRADLEDPYKTLLPAEVNEGPYAEYERWKAANPDFEAATSRWFAAKQQLEEAAPIEIIWHCSYDYPMYVIAMKGTQLSAARGYPKKIEDTRELVTTALSTAKIAEAARFVHEHELLDRPFEPAWLLFSMWG